MTKEIALLSVQTDIKSKVIKIDLDGHYMHSLIFDSKTAKIRMSWSMKKFNKEKLESIRKELMQAIETLDNVKFLNTLNYYNGKFKAFNDKITFSFFNTDNVSFDCEEGSYSYDKIMNIVLTSQNFIDECKRIINKYMGEK